MEGNAIRNIVYYRDYYLRFFEGQRPEVKQKLNWTLYLISTVKRVPQKYFRYISGSNGIYEVRVEVESEIFRIFCFFDKGSLVVLMNGFQKKSLKTPRKEIERAEKIKAQYHHEKAK
jgi:phage-related protein